MAKASKTTHPREVVKIVQEEQVTLTLSVPEARTLLAISSRVSGSPADSSYDNPSPRMHVDSIYHALNQALQMNYNETPEFNRLNGSLNFDSYGDDESEHWQ